METNIFDFITILGLLQGVLISWLILRNKTFGNSPNKYLAAFLLLIVIIGADNFFNIYYNRLNNFWFTFCDIVGDDIPWILLLYPALFTFFLKASKKVTKVPVKLLYVPFFIALVFNFFIDLELDFNVKSIPFIMNNIGTFYFYETITAILISLALHCYLYFLVIKKGPNTDIWLIKFWNKISILLLVWFFLEVGKYFFEDDTIHIIVYLSGNLTSIFIYWVTYTGFLQFNLATNRKSIREKLEGVDTIKKKHVKPKISRGYFEKLLHLIEEDTIYRDENLGRENVAEKLSISSSYLTQLIKQNTDMSFTDFINSYRIKDVEKMLIDDSFANFDILSIGLEAGFKSKSTFYSAFKKINGVTPLQFRKNKS